MDASQYQPPTRRSLSDEELDARVTLATTSHSGVEALMELLVAQEALRAQEDAELEAWIAKMEAEGSQEAMAALAKFRGEEIQPYTGQVPAMPEVDTQPEPVVEIAPISEPFTWFTKPEPVVENVVENPESSLTSENEVEEPQVVTSFPWDQAEVSVEEPIEVIEEVLVVVQPEEITPVGTESADEFEELIHAAAAEEELTALEEAKSPSVAKPMVSNLVNPSDLERNRKPLSQLFVWVGASATLVPMLLVYFLINVGLSASAIAFDIAAGYLIAGSLVAMAALAGKRSGLSTATISRAIFGVWGNSVPMTFVSIARVLLSTIVVSVFLYLMTGIEIKIAPFDTVVAQFMGIKLTTGFIVGIVVVTIATVFALLKHAASTVAQTVLSVLAFVLVFESFGGLIGDASLSFATFGNEGIFSRSSIGGLALVIMVVSLCWIPIAPNLSKRIPMRQRGVKVFFSVLAAHLALPSAVAAIVLLWFGPVGVSSGQGLNSLAELVLSLPQWSRGALVSGVALALVYILMLSVKSSALEFMSLLRIRSKVLAILLSGFVTLAALLLFTQTPSKQTVEYLVNVAVVAGVLTAGWLGMFVTDVALRKIAYHELSLTRSYGFYGKFNSLSVAIWIITLVEAILLIPVNLYGLSFMGTIGAGFGLTANIGDQAIGFTLVLVSGMALTLAARIPQIRKQEKEVLAVESRREALNDIFVGQE